MVVSHTPPHTLIAGLLATLQALPAVEVELLAEEAAVAPNGYRADAELRLRVQKDQPFLLRVDARRELYPRDVREALWRMSAQGIDASSTPMIRLIAAESISPGAKELLKLEHVGYYDLGGSLYLPAPRAYIYVDKPVPRTMAKAIGALFTGRRAQVIHALLLHSKEWLTGKQLAQHAQASTATVSQVIGELEKLELLRPNAHGSHKGRQVREPGALLDQWAEQRRFQRRPVFRRFFVPELRADELNSVTHAFDLGSVDYAISFEAAAQRYEPFLSSVSQIKCRAISGQPLEAALALLDARAVEEGANLLVIETRSMSELLFKEHVGTSWLASPIQVYLDLLQSEGRAKELAQHLRKLRIRF